MPAGFTRFRTSARIGFCLPMLKTVSVRSAIAAHPTLPNGRNLPTASPDLCLKKVLFDCVS